MTAEKSKREEAMEGRNKGGGARVTEKSSPNRRGSRFKGEVSDRHTGRPSKCGKKGDQRTG